MDDSQPQVYEFGRFRLDARKRLLIGSVDEHIPLTPKVLDLLLYLVKNHGRIIEKDELMREVWSDTIVEESNLSQNISILRKVLGEKRGEHQFIATIPGHGYKFVAEVTPISNEAGNADAGIEELPATPQTSRVIWIVAAIAIVLLIGFWLARRQYTESHSRIESIAVMPFVNESGNPELEYLSDGMAETLISSLSQLPNLKVKARSSSFRFRGKISEPETIAAELKVQAILVGTVARRGDALALHIELVDATDSVLWSSDYKEPTANLVALQTDIARDVSQKIRIKLSPGDKQKLAKSYTQNPQAYQLYLKGRYYWNKRSKKNVDKSVEYLQQAIVADPNYALAYAALADDYALIPDQSFVNERMSKAREAALKALSLDNNLAEAHTALGRVLASHDYDFAGAELEYRRAILLNPRYADAHYWYAQLLGFQTRWDEASAEYRQVLELEPLSLVFNANYGALLTFSRRYDEAIVHLKNTLELDENFVSTHGNLILPYEFKGNYEESVKERALERELMGDFSGAAMIREAYARGGWPGYLKMMTSDHRPSFVAYYLLAACLADLGEKDAAFEALNKAYENRETGMLFLKVDPRLDILRTDPRFQELLLKAGFHKNS